MSLVQHKESVNDNYHETIAITLDSNSTSGNTMVYCIASNSVPSISDTQSNTYTLIESGNSKYGLNCRVYVSENITGGTMTITANFGVGTYSDGAIIAREYNGVLSSSLDVHTSLAETTYVTSHNTGTTATTNQASETVVAIYMGDDSATTITEGSGFGNMYQAHGFSPYMSTGASDKTVASIGAQTSTLTTSTYTTGLAAILTLKNSTATTNAKRMTLLGVGP